MSYILKGDKGTRVKRSLKWLVPKPEILLLIVILIFTVFYFSGSPFIESENIATEIATIEDIYISDKDFNTKLLLEDGTYIISKEKKMYDICKGLGKGSTVGIAIKETIYKSGKIGIEVFSNF